ncbi:MAG: hypothetical protein K8J08_17295 [Thermoanaerobaculia bacterium]|nr:hypothetical protein [Thermoanaerobaculia bacterium]
MLWFWLSVSPREDSLRPSSSFGAGSDEVVDTSLDSSIVFLLYLGINSGAFIGPRLAGATSPVAGHQIWFLIVAGASVVLSGVGVTIAALRMGAAREAADNGRKRWAPIAFASLLVAWYWFAFSAGFTVLTPAMSRWQKAGNGLAWLHAVPPALLIVLSLLLAILSLVASETGTKLPSTPTILAMALALCAVSTLLLYPISISETPPVLLILVRELLQVFGELALVVVIAAVASGFGTRVGSLVVVIFLTLTLHPGLSDLADSYGKSLSGGSIRVTTLVSIGLAMGAWGLRGKLSEIEPKCPGETYSAEQG